MKTRRFIACLALLCVAAAGAARAEGIGTRSAIGWKRVGASTGRPLIFLPPIGFPGDVWANVYKAFEKDHPIYAVTLAGTGSVPPIKAPYIEPAVADLIDMIQSENLEKPVLIGHLVGAHLALRVAAATPDRVGGVFAIPANIQRGKTPEERNKQAEGIEANYRANFGEMWKPMIRQHIQKVCNKADIVNQLCELSQEADQECYTGFVGEMVRDDLLPQLAKITAPVMFATPVVFPSKATMDKTRETEMAELTTQMIDELKILHPNVARCDFIPIRDSRLFVTFEQPERVSRSVARFVQKLENPNAYWGTTVQRPAAAGSDSTG